MFRLFCFIHIYIYIYIHTYIHTYTIIISVCISICICMCIYIYIYIDDMCVCIYIYIYIYIYGRPAWCCDMGADRTMITLVFVSDVFTNRLLKSTTIRFRQLARALHALLSVTLSYRSPYGTQRASCLDRAALNTRTRKMDSRIMHYIRGLAQGYTPERAYIA